MSASLVGSEMCIRDRSWSVTLPHGYGRPRWSLMRPADGPAPPRPRPVSVSYTHLTLPTICSV
eukprot:852990-Alexandrium_andersonii.AAC.1